MRFRNLLWWKKLDLPEATVVNELYLVDRSVWKSTLNPNRREIVVTHHDEEEVTFTDGIGYYSRRKEDFLMEYAPQHLVMSAEDVPNPSPM